LRVAAVVLLAWAFARPLTAVRPLISASSPGDAARVVILDQSQSMAAADHGITSFERARPVAAEFLSGASGLRGNLIFAAAQPRAVFDALSNNFAAMRDDLGKTSPRSERLNLQAAINLAGEMLAAAGDESLRRELVIVTDLQRSNWATADFSSLPKQTVIQLQSAAPKQTPANL